MIIITSYFLIGNNFMLEKIKLVHPIIHEPNFFQITICLTSSCRDCYLCKFKIRCPRCPIYVNKTEFWTMTIDQIESIRNNISLQNYFNIGVHI